MFLIPGVVYFQLATVTSDPWPQHAGHSVWAARLFVSCGPGWVRLRPGAPLKLQLSASCRKQSAADPGSPGRTRYRTQRTVSPLRSPAEGELQRQGWSTAAGGGRRRRESSSSNPQNPSERNGSPPTSYHNVGKNQESTDFTLVCQVFGSLRFSPVGGAADVFSSSNVLLCVGDVFFVFCERIYT